MALPSVTRSPAAFSGLALAALSGLYTGYWLFASETLKKEVAVWADQRRAEGYRISFDEPVAGGFPFGVELTLPRPSLVAPGDGGRWSAPALTVTLHPLRLSGFTMAAAGPHDIGLPAAWGGNRVTLTTAATVLGIETDGDGARQSLTVEGARIEGLAAPVSVANLAVSVRRPRNKTVDHTVTTLEMTFNARQVDLPPGLELPLGPRLAEVALKGRLKGNVPGGDPAQALTAWRVDGGTFEVDSLGLDWLPLKMKASGTLALDEQLQPMGALSAAFTGFFEAVESLSRRGIVRSRDASMVKVVLGMMARTEGGGPPTLNLPVTVQDQVVYAGPARLFPVPTVRWSATHKPRPPLEHNGAPRLAKPVTGLVPEGE